MLRIKSLILILLCALSASPAFATHIVGGDISYDHLGGNSYRITLNIYVDCKNGSPDAIQQDQFSKIGVFTSSGAWYQSLSITRSGPFPVKETNYGCVIPPSDECVNLYVYTSLATLPDRAGGYYLEFQRCCRNHSIKNIVDPGGTGTTFRTTIPERAGIGSNSSPRFIGVPPNFLCTNEPLSYDHSAQDPNGDSLVYELVQPLHGAGTGDPSPDPTDFVTPTGVNWSNGYSTTIQVPSTPVMKIDPVTGLFELTPTATGQYVVGIAVHEFRNGVKINTVFRDFQFNIYNCQFTTKSNFNPAFGICSDTVKFTNGSTGSIDRYKWDFGIDSLENDTTNTANPTFVFPGPGTYTIKLTAFSNAGCGNTSSKTVHILPKYFEELIRDSIVCYGDSLKIGQGSDEPGINYFWSPSEGLNNPSLPDPTAVVTADKVYTLRKSTVSCYMENEITVYKNTIDAFFEHEYLPPCDGLRVKFFAKGQNYDELHWDFGDPTTFKDISTQANTSWFYSDTGIIYARMAVSNEFCVDTMLKPIRIIFPEVFTAQIDTFICTGDRITIGPLNDTSIISFVWSNVDYMESDTLLYPSIQPTKSVSYVLTKTYAWCQTKDSFNVIVNELPDLTITRSYPEKVCVGDSILLEATGNYSFEWFPKEGVSSPYSSSTWVKPDTGGWYRLQAQTQAKCTENDSVILEMYPQWEIELEPYYVICRDEVFLPEVKIDDAEFRWQLRGDDVLHDSLRQEGVYTLNVLTRCQDLWDTVEFAYYHDTYCIVDFPNAFSPNGDGINDTYPYGGYFNEIFGVECKFDSYHLVIFDRWGEIVFRSETPGEEWDGQYKKNGTHQDVYGYYLSYREWDYCRGGWVVKTKSGNISLMR